MKNLKQVYPHLIAIAIFLIVVLAYFSPILEGKVLKQGDITNHLMMSKEISDFRAEKHTEPLWTNSMFGGMPAFQISTIYYGNIIKNIDNIITLGLPVPMKYIFLMLIGFYFLLLTLRIDPWLAIVGSVAFAFSSYFFIILEAGHNSKAHAIGYMAPVLASVIITIRHNKWIGALLTAIFLSLEISTNHLQITYYLGMIIAVYLLSEIVFAIKEKSLKNIFGSGILLAGASIIAVLLNISLLWTTFEYSKYSTRGKSDLTINQENKTSGLDRDYATQWSYGVGESMTLMVPNFKGGASVPLLNNKSALKVADETFVSNLEQMQVGQYWGDQPFTSGPVYAGAIIVFLALLGFLIVENKYRWFLLAASVLSLLLAWGNNFMGFTNFFLDYVPGYNKFRAVSMIMVIIEFTLPLVALLGLNHILTKTDNFEKIQKKFFISVGVTAGLCLIMWLMPGMFNDFLSKQETQQFTTEITKLKAQASTNPEAGQYAQMYESFQNNLELVRTDIFKTDVLRSFIFIVLAAALIFLFSKKLINSKIVIIGIGLLILVDMWSVNKRYLDEKSFVSKRKQQTDFEASMPDNYIKQLNTIHRRVLNLSKSTFNDASTSYMHQSVGGYHGAKLKRYQELIDLQLSNEIQLFINTLQNNPNDTTIRAALQKMKAHNMLNTGFIIYNEEALPIINTYAYGNVWFVNNIKMVANADEEIKSISDIDPQTTALVDKRFENMISKKQYQSDTTAKISLKSYEPNHLVYESNSKTDLPAIFSEIFYDKGWNVTIDGKPSEYFRANFVLRGMIVPAGKHTIEFKFEPKSYFLGEKISLFTSILVLLLIAAAVFFGWKKYKNQSVKIAS